MSPPSKEARRPASILIVDDDEIVREIMRAELEADGFAVAEAADGVEACESCWSQLPDLVIADVVMPRMDGFTLCRELRANPLSKFVPILQATGLDDIASIEKAYEAGATDFIANRSNGHSQASRALCAGSARAFETLRHNRRHDRRQGHRRGRQPRKSEFLANMSHELRTRSTPSSASPRSCIRACSAS